MTKEILEEEGVKVVEFNPWLWKEAGDLVKQILNTIATGFSEKELEGVARNIGRYARHLAGANPLLSAGGKLVAEMAKDMGLDLGEDAQAAPGALLKMVKKELREKMIRMVVMVDDVDRLEHQQLQEVLRAVRLAGNLPGVVYVIALDKHTVAKQLRRDGFDGAAYLEKIIEMEVPVPRLQIGQKIDLLEKTVNEVVLQHGESSDIDEGTSGLIRRIMLPLVQTPRDIKRYGMRLAAALETAPREIRRDDLLALEVVRMKMQEAALVLEERAWDITAHEGMIHEVAGYTQGKTDERAAQAGRELLDAAGTKRHIMEGFIASYLPRIGRASTTTEYNWAVDIATWRREGRIADLAVLEAALGKQTPQELKQATWTQEAFAKLESGEGLNAFLGALPVEHIEWVVGGLEHMSHEFTDQQARETIPVLMTWLGKVPHRERQEVFGHDTEMTFIRVVARLLEAMGDETREKEAGGLTEKIPSPGAQARFLNLLRWQDKQGRQGCTKQRCEALEEEWMKRIERMTAEEALESSEIFETAKLASRIRERTGNEWVVWDDPMLTRRIIREASAISVSWHGATTVRRTQLHWDSLEKIWGGEEAVIQAVKAAQEATPTPTEEEKRYLDLAWEYWTGRSESNFSEQEQTRVKVTFGEEMEKQINHLRGKHTSREEVCGKALKRGHAHESVGARRGLVPGRPRYEHRFGVEATVTSVQKQWAERYAEEYGVRLEDTWATILAAGLDELEATAGGRKG